MGWKDEENYIRWVTEHAASLGIAVVATNRVEFIHQDEFEAHEMRVCINDGRVLDDSRRPRNFTDQQYLRDENEMSELFSDIPQAIENTVEVAKRCNVFLNFDEDYLPDYPGADGVDVGDILKAQAEEGLATRLKC